MNKRQKKKAMKKRYFVGCDWGVNLDKSVMQVFEICNDRISNAIGVPKTFFIDAFIKQSTMITAINRRSR